MNIIFVRHGSTNLNEKGVYCGVNDSELSEDGIMEINNIKKYIKKIKIDEAYTSSLKRAIQTTRLITDKYKIDSRLSEMNFGIFEGLSYDEIEKNYAEESKSWGKDTLNYKIPKGESLKDVFARTYEFIEDIKCNKGNVLVISHGGIIRCALSLVFQNYDYFYKFKVINGSASVISIEDGYMFIKGINCRDNLVDVLGE